MDLVKLRQKLLAAARACPPSDRVPYAFENRILARLQSQPPFDYAAFWARALWRAAAPCLATMLLLGAWALVSPAPNPPATDLSQQLESTLLAAADSDQPADSTW